jgi:hypothetical protein
MMKKLPCSSTYRNIALIAALSLSLAACAMHWPWRRAPVPPPQPVHQVIISSDMPEAAADAPEAADTPDAADAPEAADASAAAAGIVQYWDRNTLLIDLTAVGGEGGATMTPIKALGWPVRLEFRVRPGSMARLEVVGAQRVVYAVAAQGEPLLLKLAPSAYHPDTAQITLRWSAADDSAH